jgi:SAM-dependent methyltransferase
LKLYTGIATLRRLGFWDQSFQLTKGSTPVVWRHGYELTEQVRRLIWDPYLRRLGAAVEELRELEPGFDAGFVALDGTRLVLGELERRARAIRTRVAGAVKRRALRPPLADPERNGWNEPGVASQMLSLVSEQLREPEGVPPFRSFIELTGMLAADFPLPRPAGLLDLGCGVGHYSELVDRYFPDRFEYTGADSSETMVEAAREAWPGRSFVVGDLLDGSVDLDGYDVVLASALIDVLPDYERALDALLGSAAAYVLLHRQRVTEAPSHVEVAPGYEGQRTHRSFLNLSDLEAIAWRNGRNVARRVHVDGEMHSFILPRISP